MTVPLKDTTSKSGTLLKLIAGGRGSVAAADDVEPGEESQYRQFLDALGVAVYTTDRDGRITFFNEAAAEFWGRRPALGEEWCGSLRLFWPDGTPMRHDECPMAIALRENRPVRGYEAIAQRPDGSQVSFAPYPTPLRDDDGTLIGAVNVLIDITERTKVMAELSATTDALVTSAAVRDEFLGLVSHELRTPVTTIFGNAVLLRDRGSALAEATRDSMVSDIAEDAERLLAVIENLLVLTRLGSGPEVELEPQVLDHLVRKAVDDFVRRQPGRQVTFRTAEHRVVVDADRTYVSLLVENLLSNADKYSPRQAEVEVELSVEGNEALVAVRDRGMGIDAADADRLFEPFYRSDAAKSSANGVGIGLAVCARVARIQGGRVWARPREGGGAEVGFALPLA